MRYSIFLLLTVIYFTNCTKEECTISDWEGLYLGSKICDGTSITDYTFSIKSTHSILAGSENLLIIDDEIVSIEKCDIIGGSSISSLPTFSYSGALNGNEVELIVRYYPGTCTWTGTKK